MRIINNHKCKDCLYLDLDNNYCQFDGNYETKSPNHYACRSFISDSDDYNSNIYQNEFDENEYGYSEDYD